MVVTSSQMLAAEQSVIANGVSAEALMEDASAGIFQVLQQFLPSPGTAVLYLGKGNNAGDALVVARHLHAAGWKLAARCVFPVEEFKELPARHWHDLGGRIVTLARPGEVLADEKGPVIILDGILGTGASPVPLRGDLADAVQEMNELRRRRHAFTVAIDIPTGLGAGDLAVEADLTVTIGFAKNMLLEDHAARHVGRLALVPLKDVPEVHGDASQRILTADQLLPSLPCRPFEFHKGQAGRVAVVAGSRGYLGAAVLSASGALRGGAGLVTLYAKEDVYPLVAPLAPAEVMVKPVRDYRELFRDPVDTIAVGPGLGLGHEDEILAVLSRADVPVVVDADALNMLARRGMDVLRKNSAPRLLTPHPGELDRLAAHFPEWKTLSRRDLALDFTGKFPHATLLLKGSRTVIASSGHPLSFNTTGNPGMASGGMGDVLTGLCAALAAQGTPLHEAACLGAWLSGRSAELAILSGHSSPESLCAGDVLRHLGPAFLSLRTLAF